MDINTYPPTPSLVLGPQLLVAIKNMLLVKMNEAEHCHHQEIQACDLAWQRRELEGKSREAALQARLQDLTGQIQPAFDFYTCWGKNIHERWVPCSYHVNSSATRSSTGCS